jgi:hypothetical protein
MALDHYVSQVYLRNFNSPVLQNRFYAMRKSSLKTFTPRSEDVCRIEEGNTNKYLTEERAIEDFLRTVEPKYNSALAKLRNGQPDKRQSMSLRDSALMSPPALPRRCGLALVPLKLRCDRQQ